MPGVVVGVGILPEVLDYKGVVIEGAGREVFYHVGRDSRLSGAFIVGHAIDCAFYFIWRGGGS